MAVVEIDQGEKVTHFGRPSANESINFQEFCLSPDREYLLATSGGGKFAIWSMKTGSVISMLDAGLSMGEDATHCWNPARSEFVIADSFGLLSFWEVGGREPIRKIEAQSGAVHAMAWHPEGNRLATADRTGVIRIWDVESGQLVSTLTGPGFVVFDLVWDRSGHRLAAACEGGMLRVFDATAGYMVGVE